MINANIQCKREEEGNTGDVITWIINHDNSSLNDKNINLFTTLQTHIFPSASTKANSHTHLFLHMHYTLISCLFDSLFISFLKWVKKTKWKSRNFSLRETDRQGETQIHRGRKRDRLGLEGGRKTCLIRKVPFKTHKIANRSHLMLVDSVLISGFFLHIMHVWVALCLWVQPCVYVPRNNGPKIHK